jgi:hypothetical protein
MRRHHVLTAAALLLLDSQLTAPLSAADLAPWSGAELNRRCLAYGDAPQSPDSQSCAAYVRGFVDGSTLVHFQADPTSTLRESFSDRAFRTRLGVRRAAQPLYCVDSTVSLSQFVAQMLTHLQEHPRERDESASAVLYGTLMRFHRCSG